MNKLFNEKTIRGDQSNFSGILEALNFDGNNKAINKAYEQHVLSVGDLDERIFLGKKYFILNCNKAWSVLYTL
jgi:retinoblastoma-like protein 2